VDFSFEAQCSVHEYAWIVASYGVCFEVCIFQYATYTSALVQAADQFEAAAVFAALPRRLIPLWHRIEVWWLKKALSRRHRSLYLLEQPDDVVAWTPLITLPPESSLALPGNLPEQPAVSQLPMPQAAPLSQSTKYSAPVVIEPTHDTSGHSTAKTIRR
jgi:hypothetical protein